MSITSHTLALMPIDIARHAGDAAGPSHILTQQADRPGPHVLINALMHGNELCGAVALDFLIRKRIRPRRGRLTYCFANVAAYGAFDPANPTTSRFVEEDMNRVWAADTLDGPRTSIELARARELRPVFESADLLLDIHSMQTASPPLTLCGTAPRGAEFAARVGLPAWIVADSGHAGGRRLIDHPRFSAPDGEGTAILAECGQHWQRETADMAVQVTLRFLMVAEAVDADDVAPWLLPLPAGAPRRVEVTQAVTAMGESFRFVQEFTGMEVIAKAGTVIAHDGEIPVMTPYDDCILIMPSRRLKPGQTAVRLGRILP